MTDILNSAMANPVNTAIWVVGILVVLVVATILAKRYNFDLKSILDFIKELAALFKKEEVYAPAPYPTPSPIPEPSPAPLPTYAGVEIKTADFFGRGTFTAAIVDAKAWEDALGGNGNFEYRNWGDNEALYTILLKQPEGLVYSSTSMYRLEDNTVVTVVGKGNDPFLPKPAKTVMEQYDEMWDAPSPCEYMMKEFNRLDVNLSLVFGPEVGVAKFNQYLANDEHTVAYVKNLLPIALENGKGLPLEVQREKCREIFAVIFNFGV